MATNDQKHNREFEIILQWTDADMQLQNEIELAADPFDVDLYVDARGWFAYWFKLRNADDIPTDLWRPKPRIAGQCFVEFVELSNNGYGI